MRFETMQHNYPWILELFAAVAEYIHRGNSPDTALARLARDHAITMDRIRHYHLEDVTGKLLAFARAIYIPPTPLPPPDQCPECGSLDITGGACMWCHNACIDHSEEHLPSHTTSDASSDPVHQKYCK